MTLLSPRSLVFATHISRRMSSAVNASGLQPSESKSLKERSIQPHEESIIKGIKEMYSCSPTENTFKIYTEDATFHDPVGIAKGVESIRAQFFGLTKIFPRADILRFRVLENPPTVPKSTILIDQDVSYFRDAKSSSPTKTVNSLLALKVNDAHLVTSHDEQWDHQKSSTSSDGFFGMLNEQRKKITASLTDSVVGKGPKM
ncbi:hypothetical protein Hypma_015872 [Hypsizygus marmoreus]|uniref:SnoaL-like domain-containing protein n=1 Tax=Hypsizygus marmoreus TaxID=39966 RepID=A0A369K7G2_HYPMA|nr:hypothetical protein Hypma_015872 [Hypsizygus marmoreus]